MRPGRWIITNIKWKDKCFSLCAVYAPNKDSPGFWNNIFSISSEFHHQLIIMGDFNTCLDCKLDRTGTYSSNNKQSTDAILQYMETHSMQDVWRVRNPDTHGTDLSLSYRPAE